MRLNRRLARGVNHLHSRICNLNSKIAALLAALIAVTTLGLALRVAAAPLAAVTRTYPGAAPCNTTLEDCINGSANGDTINIAAGIIITDEIFVGRAITLNGAGPANTILQARPNQRVFAITSDLAAGVVLANLRITGGNVNNPGGGLHSAGGTPLKLVNVEFRGNSTSGPNSGGGAFVIGPLTLIDAVFIDNHAPNGAGGGLRATDSVTIFNGTFARNTSLNPGGALRVDGPLFMQATVVISNSTTNVGAGLGNGGGVRADGGLRMLGGEVRGNSSQNDGGGVYVQQPATISGTLFLANRADNGAGIYATDAISLHSVELRQNVAFTMGGGLLGEQAVTLVDGVLVENRADGCCGGALAGGDAHVADSRVEANRARYGGGLYTGNVAITATVLSANRAAEDGGAVFANGNYVTVTASSFIDNRATGSAGGLWAEAGDENAHTIIAATEFFSNSAGSTGGGLHINGGIALIEGGSFERNHAGPEITDGTEQGGGGLYLSGGTAITLTGVLFDGNSSEGRGGGLATDTTTVVTASTFAANRAATEGGGLFVAHEVPLSLTVTASDFLSNTAGYGGGLATDAPLSLVDNWFISNTATHEGGGLASVNHTTLRQSVFVGNRANLGGAVWLGVLNGHSSPQVAAPTNGLESSHSFDRAAFFDNASDQDGAAIFVNSTTALTLTNSALAANRAGAQGGAIYNRNKLTLLNVTIAGNQAAEPGGGILTESAAFTLANSILWANQPDQLVGLLPLTIDPPNIIQGGAFGMSAADPHFLAAPDADTGAPGDLRLVGDSPAIDAGANALLPAGLTQDLGNLPRFFDVAAVVDSGSGTPPIVDLGAHELNAQFPVAAPGGPYTANEGAPVALDASGSNAANAITSYEWDCTDDGSFDITAATPTGSTCTYADDGLFTLRLRVREAAVTSATATATVTISNVAPGVTPPAHQNTVATVGQSFALGSFADPGLADGPWQVTVAWGDTPQDTEFTVNTQGSLPNQTHTYATPGPFLVQVTVVDKDGGSATTSFNVQVAPSGNEGEELFLPALSRF